MSFKWSWDARELKASRRETEQFYSYFLTNIASEMKGKMQLPIRRSAGLDDNFFYNCPESINSCIKKEIDQQNRTSESRKINKVVIH